MAKASTAAKAMAAIEKHGCLLVYPIKNSKEPLSLWSVLYPRTEMVWEWSDEGNSKVADLWHLREQLSRSGEVVYAKWYKGRATFFSKAVFTLLLSYLGSARGDVGLTHSSQEALDNLLMDSPQSTKVFKENLDWQGKMMEAHFNRALKPLWENLFIVGCGETQDSSFPSLNMAASQTLFEELWEQSLSYSSEKALFLLTEALGEDSHFLDFAQKIKKKSLTAR